MQSTVTATSRPQHSFSELDEGLHARSRRRVSATLGKTHFRLASGLVQQQQHYQHERVAAQSYDDAWFSWLKRDRQVDEQQRASYSSSSSPSFASLEKTLFEQVPRDATRPIMSRLPLECGERDAIAEEPTKAGNLDYLTSEKQSSGSTSTATVRGIHPDATTSAAVTYTRARLPDIDEESLHLWQALHALRNTSDDYAHGYDVPERSRKKLASLPAPHPIAPGMDAGDCPAFSAPTSSASDRALALVKRLFNWDALPSLPEEEEYVWYGVAFRSKRREQSESINLYEDDRRSHEEAVNSGGLLMYWYGLPNQQTGHNLATCIWTNREDAIRASSLPLHARAAAHALKAYESFELNRYALRKVRGETRLRLEEWIE